MTTVWERMLGPSVFLTAGWGKVVVGVTFHDTGESGTLDGLAWEGSADVGDGPLEEEVLMGRLRVLVSDAEMGTDLTRAIGLEDALTIGGVAYRVVGVEPDPPGVATMTELTLERLERMTGFASGDDRPR